MEINFGSQKIFQFAAIRPTDSVPQSRSSSSGEDGSQRTDLLRARNLLLDLYRGLQEIEKLANIKIGADSTSGSILPNARSNPALSLDLTTTAATLKSYEEINTLSGSFSPIAPQWFGLSTAQLTIGGVYNGAQGASTLSFSAEQGGVRGTDQLRIRVRDALNQNLANVPIHISDAIDTQYEIGNGLYFSLGAGTLERRDKASLDVLDTATGAFNPDNPFNGIGNESPNFDADITAIADGEFQINGATISVSSSDSMNGLIDRINQSDVGVSAAYNSMTEQVEITQLTSGSAPTIDIQGDTSNIITAAKLGAAVVVPGTDSESDLALQDVSQFATVQGGDFQINDELVAVDPANDSLNSVLDNINASTANVNATFDAATKIVSIGPQAPDTSLTIAGNGTGVFSALNIPEGEVDSTAQTNGVSRRRSYEVADRLEELFENLNDLFQDRTFVGGEENTSLFRNPLEAAIEAVFGDDDGSSKSIFGLEFNDSSGAKRVGQFADIDRRDFTRALQKRGNKVKEFFASANDTGGFLKGLENATRQSIIELNKALGTTSTLIDELV